jgi:hypothetical protein
LVVLTLKSFANLKTLQNHWGPEQDAVFIKIQELFLLLSLCSRLVFCQIP